MINAIFSNPPLGDSPVWQKIKLNLTKDFGDVFTLIWWDQHQTLAEGLPIHTLALTMEFVWSVVGSRCDARVPMPKMDGYNKVSLTWDAHLNQRGNSPPRTVHTYFWGKPLQCLFLEVLPWPCLPRLPSELYFLQSCLSRFANDLLFSGETLSEGNACVSFHFVYNIQTI